MITQYAWRFSIGSASMSSQINRGDLEVVRSARRGRKKSAGKAEMFVMRRVEQRQLRAVARQRDAVSLEGTPCLEVGGGVTTAVNFRIIPSDLLKM